MIYSRFYTGGKGPYPPEVLSLSITNKCNQNCPYCYVDHGNKEMSISDIDHIASSFLKDSKVLQITVGGGEPGLHSQFDDVMARLRTTCRYLSVTTNSEVLFSHPDTVLKYCDGIGISYHKKYENRFWDAISRI